MWGGLVKAITLEQPWATLIALGVKRVETTSWPTQHRGTLAIHAAAVSSEQGLHAVTVALDQDDEACQNSRFAAETAIYPLGAIVCVVQLAACEQMTDEMIEEASLLERAVGDWRPGRYAWRIGDIVPFNPAISARGEQGLWEWHP